MSERFVFPNYFSKEDISLFSILDLKQVCDLPIPTDGNSLESVAQDFCQGFGIDWQEKNKEFIQVFGYRCATIPEMDCVFGKERKGYDYICFKSLIFPKNEKMLTDKLCHSFEDDTEIFGFKNHSSRYYFSALKEATYQTYKATLKEAEGIARRLNKPLVEVIPKRIKSSLDIESMNFHTELYPFSRT